VDETRRRVVDRPSSGIGAIDILINNAVVGTLSSLLECTHGQARALMELNFFGAVGMTQDCGFRTCGGRRSGDGSEVGPSGAKLTSRG